MYRFAFLVLAASSLLIASATAQSPEKKPYHFPFLPMVAAVAGTHAGTATLHVGAASSDNTSDQP